MADQLDVLKTVARRLEAAGIPYMVSGSVAMNFFAQPRMTRDIDIVVELGPRDVGRLRALFSQEFYIDAEDIRDAIQDQGLFNIIHNQSIVKIDFIIRKDAAYRLEEFRRRRTVRVEDASIWIVSPEDLILSKLAWAKDSRSEMQLNDVKNLIAAIPELDWEYVDRWASGLGVADLLKGLRQA